MLVPFWAQLARGLPMMCRKHIGMDLATHQAERPKGESEELTLRERRSRIYRGRAGS